MTVGGGSQVVGVEFQHTEVVQPRSSIMSITIDAVFDGEVLRPQSPLPLVLNQHYSVTIEDAPIAVSGTEDAWSVLRELAGTYDGPTDWSSEHDHYIYGTPKRNEQSDV
jgi:hypothetical protein